MPSRILKIAERHLTKPQQVKIAGEKAAVGKLPRIRQVAYIVRRNQKPQALDRILDMEDPTSAIVFCRTRIEVDTLEDGFLVHGRAHFHDGAVTTAGDHRIAMAFAVAGRAAGVEVELDDPDCIAVSFPGFAAALEKVA